MKFRTQTLPNNGFNQSAFAQFHVFVAHFFKPVTYMLKKFAELTQLCRERKLDTKGNKATLAERLALNDNTPVTPAQTIAAQLKRAAGPATATQPTDPGTSSPLRRWDRSPAGGGDAVAKARLQEQADLQEVQKLEIANRRLAEEAKQHEERRQREAHESCGDSACPKL